MHSFQSLTGPSMCRNGKCLLLFDVTSCDVACFNLLFSHWMTGKHTKLILSQTLSQLVTQTSTNTVHWQMHLLTLTHIC